MGVFRSSLAEGEFVVAIILARWGNLVLVHRDR